MNEFRKELVKMMPGYEWTVHQTKATGYLEATGTQSSGSNRLSTLSVSRREQDGTVRYEAKSAGYGLRARWLHTNEDETLARALRGLQDHYEATANTYRSHAECMKVGRAVAAPNSAVAAAVPETNFVMAEMASQQLVRQVEDYASGRAKDVARGAETPRLAALQIQKYGRGLVDAVAVIYGTPRAADPISKAVDEATAKIDPLWREHDQERWAGRPADVVAGKDKAPEDQTTPRTI